MEEKQYQAIYNRNTNFLDTAVKLFTLLSASFCALLASAQVHAQPTLSPNELQALLVQPDVRVVDIRPPTDFVKDHIAGSLSAPYAVWRGPAHSPGTLPALDALTQTIRELGINENTHNIIVYAGADTSDFGSAARVYWTMKYLGLNNLSVLNGGIKSWQSAGLPLTQDSTTVKPSNYTPVLNDSVIASQADVLSQINNPQAHLVDARPANFFQGKVKAPTAAIPGTIQGSINIEHSQWFKPNSIEIVSKEDAKELAAQNFPQFADDTITFCNTGHWAATDWFALSELAGLPNIRMYPESMADWTNTAQALPMNNEPSRAQQIASKFKALFN